MAAVRQPAAPGLRPSTSRPSLGLAGLGVPEGPAQPAAAAMRADAEALLERAADAGIRAGDPLFPMVEALARTLISFGQVSEEHAARLAEVTRGARAAADAQAITEREARATVEATTIERLGDEIVRRAELVLRQRERRLDRLGTLTVGSVAALVALLALLGGYFLGAHDRAVQIASTEAGLRAAFADGLTGAREWVQLMSWNDIRSALRACEPFTDSSGRKACRLPMWVSPPVLPVVRQ